MKFPGFIWYSIQLPDEKKLLHRTAQGDEIAFREIFETYRHAVYAYSIHLLKNDLLADDIVQDVFLKVWLNRQKLTEINSFNAWFFTIVKNKIIDVLKMQLKENSLLQRNTLVVVNEEIEKNIFYKDYELLVHEAVGRLTPQQQLIYRLSRKEGLRHSDIAAKLNISPNTVKEHLVQALRSIRKFITPHLGSFLMTLYLCIKFF